jgi:hypothetical protein
MSSVSDLSVVAGGEVRIIYVGQKVRLSDRGEKQGLGKKDDLVVVAYIEDNDHPPDAEIGVERVGQPHGNWDGGFSLTVWVSDFLNIFNFHESSPMIVNRDYLFKKINLKGMTCKIIAKLDRLYVFVEMEKDIGGGSCDGIGRQGHCIPIKREFLTPSKKKERRN